MSHPQTNSLRYKVQLAALTNPFLLLTMKVAFRTERGSFIAAW